MSLVLTSPAFQHAGEIPARYTCEGEDVSLELRWSGVPGGAASLALIFDDPDDTDSRGARATWVHWVLYNIPVSATGLPEGIAPRDLPAGTLEGLNDWKHTGWRGPCPPKGRHHYSFKLYALDTVLPDLYHPTKAKLETAMDGHVLSQAELIGTYEKGLLGSFQGR